MPDITEGKERFILAHSSLVSVLHDGVWRSRTVHIMVDGKQRERKREEPGKM
jgi:hypothetical protein